MKDSNAGNSTERLLTTIRKKGHVAQKATGSHPLWQDNQSSQKKIKKKSLSLGVLFDATTVAFALAAKEPGLNKSGLVKWAVIDLPAGMKFTDEAFPEFLFEQLHDFTQGRKGLPIWCNINSSDIKLRHIKIPNVKASKIANAAYWGLRKELDFDTDLEVFDCRPVNEYESGGIKKIKVLTWIVKKEKLDILKSVFAEAGHTLAGITALPFAVQNFIFFDHISIGEAPVTLVNLSRDNSEIFCLSKEGILFSRVIRTDFFDILKNAERNDMPSPDTWDQLDWDDSLSHFIQSCERLLGKVVRTGEYCSQNYAGNTPMDRYLFFGDLFNRPNGFFNFIKKKIPTPIEKFMPALLSPTGSPVAQLPDTSHIPHQVTLAAGIALSSNALTPNFIYTSQDKLDKKNERKVNLIAIAAFLITGLFCTGIWNLQGKSIANEQNKINAMIKKQKFQFAGVDMITTKTLIDQTKKRQNQEEKYISTFLPLAMINSICTLTPQTVKISGFEAIFTASDKYKSVRKNTGDNNVAKIILSGAVVPGTNNPEADLTRYVLHLGDTNLISNVKILKKKLTIMNQADVLQFKLSMDVHL